MKVEVCLTPELIHQHQLEGKLVVVVDIFRATSCMITGMAQPIRGIYPVESVEECIHNGEKGMVMAGERGGQKIEHFDIGNSPFEYLEAQWHGRDICISTTNGTLTIKRSEKAKKIIIGAFLNLKATAEYILNQPLDVVIHCAGWKGTPNLEDTLFAGALVKLLLPHFELKGDSSYLALALYQNNQDNLLAAAENSGHAHRLAGFGIKKDIEFCMKLDLYDLVVGYENGRLFRI